MNALNIPRPAWMTEDLVRLDQQARRFITEQYAIARSR
jgi:long-chain-acyl-CoA dehydrogenase